MSFFFFGGSDILLVYSGNLYDSLDIYQSIHYFPKFKYISDLIYIIYILYISLLKILFLFILFL